MSKETAFRAALDAAKNIVVLTGAGISAESGIPTFRGAGGLWRSYNAMELATPEAFQRDPSLVWEFYHYRRTVVAKCGPNPAHFAVASLQRACNLAGKKFTLLTQNIDRLHQAAGSTDVVELHGSLWLVKPVGHPGFLEEAGLVWENRDNPICAALEGKGAPDAAQLAGSIPAENLPHFPDKDGARKMLRPAVVWFGETLDPRVVSRMSAAIDECDLLLVIGTSAVVYPAAAFAPIVASQGGVVAEVNLEPTKNSALCQFSFQGQSATLLPLLLDSWVAATNEKSL